MARTRAQNEATAARCAALFRSLLRPVATACNLPADDLERFDLALSAPDGKRLWELYLGARFIRGNVLPAYWKEAGIDPSSENVPVGGVGRRSPPIASSLDWWKTCPRQVRLRLVLYAFLARAFLTPAAALRGRAVQYLEDYLKEGLEYAAWALEPDDEAARAQLLELWSTPDLRNLDIRQEVLYVPSNAKESSKEGK